MEFKYDEKKYSLENMKDKVDLKHARFCCINDHPLHSFCIEEYDPEYTKIYDWSSWEKRIIKIETKRIVLCFNDAVEYEYQKLLSELPEEQHEFLNSLVKYKEHTAMVEGYNGSL